jgi:hypothetical protein
MPRPKSQADKKVFEIWRDISPSDAFVAGFPDCAGKIFIPTRDRIDAAREQISATLSRCENDSQRKLLACLDTYLSILEPGNIPGYILDAFFAHLMKEGVKTAHMTSLAEYGKKALETYSQENKGRDWPIGQKLLAVIRCDGLLEILDVCMHQTQRWDTAPNPLS